MPSPLVMAALAAQRAVRRDYDDLLEASVAAALEDCSGVLLNARGRAAGIEARSLFLGPERRALAYASEELAEWWNAHPRLTFAAYEAQRVADYVWTG